MHATHWLSTVKIWQTFWIYVRMKRTLSVQNVENMNFETLLQVIVGIGIPSIIGAFIYIGKKLQILDTVEEKCKDIESIDKRLIRVETKLGIPVAITGFSPFRLTPIGEKILEESSMKKMVMDFKDQLLQIIKKKNPKTAYDVQETTREVFQEFDFGAENLEKIKDYCFHNPQWGISDILDTGAVYFFREVVAPEFKIQLDDLNNSYPNV